MHQGALVVRGSQSTALFVDPVLPPILACLFFSFLPSQRVKACWEYAGRNALHRLQQPKAACALVKRYSVEGQWLVNNHWLPLSGAVKQKTTGWLGGKQGATAEQQQQHLPPAPRWLMLVGKLTEPLVAA